MCAFLIIFSAEREEERERASKRARKRIIRQKEKKSASKHSCFGMPLYNFLIQEINQCIYFQVKCIEWASNYEHCCLKRLFDLLLITGERK